MRSEASTAKHRQYKNNWQKERYARGYSTVNVPPDLRADLQAVKKRLQNDVGIRATDADVLRHLIKIYNSQT